MIETATLTPLEKLQKRIKGAKMYHAKRANRYRLYIPFGKRGRGIKTSAWFEVVNDRLTPFVKVENDRHPNYYDDQLSEQYQQRIYNQFREIINDCELERKETPLNERLKDNIIPVHESSLKYQADALRFLCSMKVSALFADTGTGKSKVVVDLCTSRYEAGQINKAVIFCPVSTKKNFKKEIERWGSKTPITWKIVGTESISGSDREFLEVLDFVDSETQIVVDESHMVKNPLAKRSKRIKKISAKTSYKVVMTGTPVTQNVHDLYMQYAILSELIIGLDSWLKFEEKYLILGGVNGDEIIGYKNIDHLMGLVEPYTFQITKAEAIVLPAKREQSIYCDLNYEQQQYYFQEKDWLLDRIDRDLVEVTDIFKTFGRMQQIASGYYPSDNGPVWIGSFKPSLFKKVDLDEKTIIFCKYVFEVDLIVEHLGKENCCIFTGQNRKDRDNELRDFVEGNKPYFVATMQSGGTGLNGLQLAARQIIFYSNSFSYFQRKQSIGRIDRQGQTKEMKVFDFQTNCGIDDKIIKNLGRKGSLANEIRVLLKDKTKLKKYVSEM